MPDVEHNLAALREVIGGYGSALVAYSGGVDSALVACVAHAVLGQRCMACIAVSPSYPARERRAAIALADTIGITCRVLETHEDADPHYAANGADRCYFCKSELYAQLTALAAAGEWSVIANGVHADDLDTHRHGMRAAHASAVRSPLLETGMGKGDVRALAKHLRLPVWDKPAAACLSSRVPHGTPITPALLRQIERAEDAVAALGFVQFRVRHHGEIARLELPVDDLLRAVACRAALVAAVRSAGYRHVTLDLAGMRSEAPPPIEPPVTLVSLNVRARAPAGVDAAQADRG